MLQSEEQRNNEEDRKRPVRQMTKPVWQALHKAAILETNPVELRRKIDVANTAIRERIDELANNQESTSVEERQEIMDALNGFQILQLRNSQTPATKASAEVVHEGAA